MKFSIRSTRTLSSEESVQTLVTLPVVSVGLTVLYPDGDDSAALVDIITVHGLSGHPQNTWTNFETQHYWPSNSLPQDIPKSRIMAFGYSTSASPFQRSTAIISDIAKQLISHLINKRISEAQKERPIIFVAHSLGGIVIKEFLHIASNTGHESLANSVCGILFLGTPHKGSHLASFMDVMNSVVKTFARVLPTDLIIKDLSSNSRHLLELDGLLRVKLGSIDIYSFYELLPMGPLKNPVVERHSALLNLPSEIEQIGLDADHRAMCKPLDRNDFIYETIAQRIMSIMNRQLGKTQYSQDLMEMSNAFASRQMEHISFLTKELHEGTAEDGLPPMFATLIQQTVNLHIKDPGAAPQAHGLDEILKSLPLHKMKSFVESVQSIIKRANALTDLLLLTERQNEQRKAEARMTAERQASEKRIQELMTENERLKKALESRRSRNLWHAGDENSTFSVDETSANKRRYESKPRSSRSRSRSRPSTPTGAEGIGDGLRNTEHQETSFNITPRFNSDVQFERRQIGVASRESLYRDVQELVEPRNMIELLDRVAGADVRSGLSGPSLSEAPRKSHQRLEGPQRRAATQDRMDQAPSVFGGLASSKQPQQQANSWLGSGNGCISKYEWTPKSTDTGAPKIKRKTVSCRRPEVDEISTPATDSLDDNAFRPGPLAKFPTSPGEDRRQPVLPPITSSCGPLLNANHNVIAKFGLNRQRSQSEIFSGSTFPESMIDFPGRGQSDRPQESTSGILSLTVKQGSLDEEIVDFHNSTEHGESIFCPVYNSERLQINVWFLILRYKGSIRDYSLSPSSSCHGSGIQGVRGTCSSTDIGRHLDMSDDQGDIITNKRMQIQGLLHRLTGLLEMGQQVITAKQGGTTMTN